MYHIYSIKITSSKKHENVIYTVVPLLKDTVWRGHTSRKDKFLVASTHVLRMYVILPFKKGHLSETRTELFGRRGVPFRGGLLYWGFGSVLSLISYQC